ncbi:hypothetical protein HUU59_11680 [bacterium]|nr:hypothetical protein [bacterium]
MSNTLRPIPRAEAVKSIRGLIGTDLRKLAEELDVTVFHKESGKLNKGWAGHTVEAFLGIQHNSIQAPNGEYWELKVVPLKQTKSGIVLKETMAITSVNAEKVVATDFGNSDLFHKLQSMIVCARVFVDKSEPESKLVKVASYDLFDPALVSAIIEDYELIRSIIREKGFNALSGRYGQYIQARTKGVKNSTTRSFYARKNLLRIILGID